MPALDGLRGAAVAAVLVYHAGHLTGGYLGVDLFFVLSGYLITSLLLAEHATTGAIDLLAFWVRRIRRLLPALLVLLGGVALFAVFVARPVDLDQIRGDALATLFYVANWHTILAGSSYWDLSLAPSPLQHTWSLAIEEQFYLVWPLVVVLLARRFGRRLDRAVGVLALGLAAASAALFLALHHWGASDTRVYEGTDTRAAALLLGVAWAAWRRPVSERVPAAVREGVGVVAALALGALWIGLSGQSPWLYRGGLPVASVLGALVVVASSDRTSPVLGRVLAVAPLRWLGLISYGLYLWHWPIFQVIDQRNGRWPLLGDVVLGPAVVVVVKLGASLAVAVASYLLVEAPIRRGAWRGRAGASAALGGMAIAGLAVVLATRGAVTVPTEAPGKAVNVAGAPHVLYVGDSVAQALARIAVADPARIGINPIDRTMPGCSQVAQGVEASNFAGVPFSPSTCVADPAGLAAATHPDAVFLLVGARPNDYLKLDGEWRQACDPVWDQHFREVMGGVVRGLASTGAPVVMGTILRTSANALPVEGAQDRIDCVNRILPRIAADVPGAEVLDLNELVCPGTGPCKEELDGGTVRPDGVHYDPGPGGRAVSDWVAAHVLRLAGLTPATGAGATTTTTTP